ncbi:hypothetical protein EGW08_001638 [Elysia chlorotica]|uniref:Uncharacterized protein n=1 Tax=Elysia chlorotica TaxID=188477 RepID=A0A433UA05_ELYCH|nr:hypothetical protein EGW08_001638 [Elysia chlorotica]
MSDHEALYQEVPLVSSESRVKLCNLADDVLTMQRLCGGHSEAVAEADERGDDDALCRHLYNGFTCVARKVPHCFLTYFQVMGHYIESPHHCNLTATQILELQNLVSGYPKPARVEDSLTPSAPSASPSITSTNSREVAGGSTSRVTIKPQTETETETEAETETGIDGGGLGDGLLFLEVDNNTTSMFEENREYNTTDERHGNSDRNGGGFPLTWSLWFTISMTSVAIYLPRRVGS